MVHILLLFVIKEILVHNIEITDKAKDLAKEFKVDWRYFWNILNNVYNKGFVAGLYFEDNYTKSSELAEKVIHGKKKN